MTTESFSKAIQHERLIKPRRGIVAIDFKELWQYRELFWFLAWRDILVRYKQTYLGVLWAVLQPLLTMVIFTIVFGKIGKFDSKGAPFAVMTFAALLPWQFFSTALTESSNSLVASSRMITKIYFPRLIVPASTLISGLVDFAIGLVILFILMPIFHVPFTLNLLLLPVFFAVAFVAALAVGFWLSALNVKYRDVKYIVPFLSRMGMYLSPIGFITLSVVPKKWLLLYYVLNPMVGVIDGFRLAVLGWQFEPYWPGLFASLGTIVLLLVSGAFYFRSTEKTFADLV